MTDRRSDNPNPLWIVLAVVILAALVLSFAPGMLLLSIIKYFGNYNLDNGQMWTFAIIASLIMFGVVYYSKKDLKKSLRVYGIFSLTIVAILALLHWGFKFKFPVAFSNYFFN